MGSLFKGINTISFVVVIYSNQTVCITTLQQQQSQTPNPAVSVPRCLLSVRGLSRFL